jgi:chromosome segregation ATPase
LSERAIPVFTGEMDLVEVEQLLRDRTYDQSARWVFTLLLDISAYRNSHTFVRDRFRRELERYREQADKFRDLKEQHQKLSAEMKKREEQITHLQAEIERLNPTVEPKTRRRKR